MELFQLTINQLPFNQAAIAIIFDMGGRTHEEIVRDILALVNGNARSISEVMQHCNLTHPQAKVYLQELRQKGFVANESEFSRKFYRVTPKGLQCLMAIENLVNFIPLLH